ncbi:MAG: Pyrrolo-quinoline quinone beta-propeller repeat-containing protein [Gemmatimonadetes bacterium]|nr:Pyrrolo-quinoline quinone beta-propeller repeat-containing protein [Gemmatimonadota bacterium]
MFDSPRTPRLGARTGTLLMVGLASSVVCANAQSSRSAASRGRAATAPRHAQAAQTDGWAAYGHDSGGARFSPLAQIDRRNVARLRVAWTYHTGETGERGTAGKSSFEATPLVMDGTMYLSTALGRIVALDPETGAERWVFDAGVDRHAGYGDFASRGVAAWTDPRAAAGAACRRRIVLAAIDARLIAVDARDGKPCGGFGRGGTVDLKAGLRTAPHDDTEYEETSPPAVVNGVIVVGSAVADNGRTDAVSGEVRGFDARTGALRWTWHPVPQDPADPAWRTWIGPRAHETGAANAWSVMAADPARGLVFVPTSSASPDYYGGERLGENRYASSIVAIRVATGRVAWHFQTVHHDLWDFDNASPPALVTVRRGGRDVPAVLQATKTGQLFVLHRDTGVPLFPVEERAVPASDVAGEEAWPTQPFSSVDALSPQRLTADDAWGPTPAAADACRATMRALRNDGTFTPPSLRGTLVVPSNIGGAHWGGLAYDPARRIAFVPVNRLAAIVQLIPRALADSVRRADPPGASRVAGWEYARMLGTPYVMRRRIFLSPERLPCTRPPWGMLVAVSLDTGGKLWEVPLGDLRLGMPAEARAAVPDDAGSPNLGGPIATAGGLVFIGATADRSLRAFDVESGRELWRGGLPAGGKATPMTYRLSSTGKQYVVVAAGGDGEFFGRGDALVAFALPDAPAAHAHPVRRSIVRAARPVR